MPIHTIGPPIDRPIIPSRRPERVGDFHFTPRDVAKAGTLPLAEAEDPEERQIRRDFLRLLDERLQPRQRG